MEPIRTSDIAPELLPALRRLPTIPMQLRPVRGAVRALSRLIRPTVTPGVTIEQPVAGVPGVRLHRPVEVRSDGALLWIHGGGMLIGAAVQDDRLCGSTALEVGIPVVSLDYRLAPEHPFPAPLDDCASGWTWLQEHAGRLGVDPARVVVGGQSAGAGLAASLAQRLHDAGGAQPLAQWLFCPMLDDRTAADRTLDARRNRVWSNRINRAAWRAYLGTAPGSATVPPCSVPARRASLAGLPAAWIGVGTIDLFHDEDRAYADRLQAAGVDAEFRSVAGAPHGFESWGADTALAQEHLEAAQAWLRERLG